MVTVEQEQQILQLLQKKQSTGQSLSGKEGKIFELLGKKYPSFNVSQEELGNRAITTKGSPFKNPKQELEVRALLGAFSGKPEIQAKLAQKVFGDDNVLVMDNAIFARQDAKTQFSPVNRAAPQDPNLDGIPSPLDLFDPVVNEIMQVFKDPQDVAGDIAQLAVPGARLGLDIAAGASGGAIGVGVAEGLSEEAVLGTALGLGLITPEEFKNKQVDVGLKVALAAGLTKAGEVGIGLITKALKSPQIKNTSTGAVKSVARFLERVKARSKSQEGSRIAEELSEKKIKDFAKGGDPDKLAKGVADGLAEAYEKERAKIRVVFDKARELSKTDIQAKDLLNSQVDSLDFQLGQRQLPQFPTTNLSAAIEEFKATAPRELVDDVISGFNGIQKPLKNKIPSAKFIGDDLIDAEISSGLEKLTDLNNKLNRGVTDLKTSQAITAVSKLKSAFDDALSSIAQQPDRPSAAAFNLGRKQLSHLETQLFPDKIQKIMTPTRLLEKEGGKQALFLEDQRLPTNQILKTIFEGTDASEKSLIRNALDKVGKVSLIDKEAPRLAVQRGIQKATETQGREGLINTQALADLSPDARRAALALSERAGPSRGVGGGGEALKTIEDLPSATKSISQLGGKQNIIDRFDKINKPRLTTKVFGGSVTDDFTGAAETSNDLLTGLISDPRKKAVERLLQQGATAEKAIKTGSAASGDITSRTLPIPGATGRMLNFAGNVIGEHSGNLAGLGAQGLRFTQEAIEQSPSVLRGAVPGASSFIQQLLGLPGEGDEEKARKLRGNVSFVEGFDRR